MHLRAVVFFVLICVGVLITVSACTAHTSTAIGHSYTLDTADEYVSRDDDGDIKNVLVDVIASVNNQGEREKRIAQAIEKSDITAQFRHASSGAEQITQTKNAIDAYATLVIIPADAVQHPTEWEDVLSYARSRGVAIIISSSTGLQYAQLSLNPMYFAAYWDVNGGVEQDNTSAFDVIMTVVEDRPHDTIFSSTLEG